MGCSRCKRNRERALAKIKQAAETRQRAPQVAVSGRRSTGSLVAGGVTIKAPGK